MGWIPTVSLYWKHTPNQSFSDPKALCHDNSLAVMSTVAIECLLLVVDWGLERQKACRLPMGMDTAHKWSAEVLWMMVPMYWVCLGQGQHHYSCGILAGWKDCGLCIEMVGGGYQQCHCSGNTLQTSL